MKIKIILCLFLIGNFLFSQEKINSLTYEIDKPKLLVSVTDELHKKVVFIYDYKLKTDFFLLDEEMNCKGKISATYPEKTKKTYLGYSIGPDSTYFIYWEMDDKIEIQALDFITNSLKTSIIDFKMDKLERTQSNFVDNGKFYILTSTKDTKLLNIYCLEKTVLVKKTIDLKDYRFINSSGVSINFHDLCKEDNMYVFNDGFRVMDNTNFSSLVLSTQKKKIYINNRKLILTFDNNLSFTQTLTINLEDYSVSQKVISKEHIVPKDEMEIIESNSYLINDYFFQIQMRKGKVFLNVRDFENNEIKKVVFEIDNFGTVYNYDLVEEDGSILKKSVLEKPNQFVRRMYELIPSINGYYHEDKYYLTFGGVSYPQKNNGAFIGGLIGGVAGSIVGALIAGNPSNIALNSYANRSVVYTKTIFDKDFKHSDLKAPNSKLEIARAFIEKEKKLDFHLIYSLGNNLYLTSYDAESKATQFYKF